MENLSDEKSAWKIPYLGKERHPGPRSTEFQIRKTHRPTPKHIKIKMPTIKDNERPLKVARQKKVIMFKETCIRVLLTS